MFAYSLFVACLLYQVLAQKLPPAPALTLAEFERLSQGLSIDEPPVSVDQQPGGDIEFEAVGDDLSSIQQTGGGCSSLATKKQRRQCRRQQGGGGDPAPDPIPAPTTAQGPCSRFNGQRLKRCLRRHSTGAVNPNIVVDHGIEFESVGSGAADGGVGGVITKLGDCNSLPTRRQRRQCRRQKDDEDDDDDDIVGGCESLPTKKARKECRRREDEETQEDKRVCGSDGITYRNFREFTRAQFNNQRLFKRNSGPCGKKGDKKHRCDRNCDKGYNPVCATDGDTYDNLCELQVANCKHNNIRLDYHGKCEGTTDRCDRNCGFNYNPICATNGRTYDNACELLVANCKSTFSNIRFAHHGQCRPRFQDHCDRNCGFNFAPVCGTDGRTYDNTCELSVENCKDNRIRFAHHGQCDRLDRCARNCGINYNPVCGTDGETYENTCELLVANCEDSLIRLAHQGECSGDTHQCGRPCFGQGLQICASDNKIYTSECALENARCLNPQIREVRCSTRPTIRPISPLRPTGPTIRPPISPPRPTVSTSTNIITPTVKTCDFACGDSFTPLCGTDGVTYQNLCFLREANCRNPRTTSFKSNGECP